MGGWSQRGSWQGLAWLAGIAWLLLWPVVQVAIVPTQDGPFHLAQAHIMALWGWQASLPAHLAPFLEWNPRLDPNLGVYPVLAVLMYGGVEPRQAYKALFLLYGALWLVATAAAARGLRLPRLAVLLCAPLAFSAYLHAGYLNYAFGLAAFFAFVALRQSTAGAAHLVRGALLTVAGLVLALTHIVALGTALVFLVAKHLAKHLAPPGTAPRPSPRETTAELTRQTLALAPSLALVVLFLAGGASQTLLPPLDPQPWATGLKALLKAGHLLSFQPVEALWAAVHACAVLLGVWTAWRQGGLDGWSERARQWGLFTLLMLVLVLADVHSAHGVSLSERWVPMVWAGLVFTLAARLPASRVIGSASAWPAAWLYGLAWAGLAGQTATRLQAYTAWQAPQMAVWEAGRIHPRSSFISIAGLEGMSTVGPSWRVRPLLHAHQLAAVASGGVGLSSPLGSTRQFGYFPLRHVAASDWYRTWPMWEEQPQQGPPMQVYRESHGGAPDVLLLVGPRPDLAAWLAHSGFGSCVLNHAIQVCRAP